jgi:hypothetical protein
LESRVIKEKKERKASVEHLDQKDLKVLPESRVQLDLKGV